MRPSILKPVVSAPRTHPAAQTKRLSFSDQQGRPLKEVRLYERDLRQRPADPLSAAVVALLGVVAVLAVAAAYIH
jgi:hypothetical protein